MTQKEMYKPIQVIDIERSYDCVPYVPERKPVIDGPIRRNMPVEHQASDLSVGIFIACVVIFFGVLAALMPCGTCQAV